VVRLQGSSEKRIQLGADYATRKGWNSLLRLYAPLEPGFDKTWKPTSPGSVQGC
jgi:hypothetical protein